MIDQINYTVVDGRTYSLFAGSTSTEGYYKLISALSDEFINKYGSAENVLRITERYRNRKRKLKRVKRFSANAPIAYILQKLTEKLSHHTIQTKSYLPGLSWFDKMRDPGLATTEEQYQLTMLEVDLVNRINKSRFDKADIKIALLPHCLRDLSKDCKSEKKGFDQVCKNCSKSCYIHAVSDLFKKYKVDPYIWMEGSFKKFYIDLKRKNRILGIFGIACIAELKSGMEKCLKYEIPALGIPLDANRCARWMGDFYPNSVNLEQIEKLLK